jgi:PIN domain nuclease of toxin-antitoxin system
LIGRNARAVLDVDLVMVSPIVELELTYLYERGRLATPPSEVFETVRVGLPFTRSGARLDAVAFAALDLAWTRDPFDRLIVANAIADRARLLTADRTILANFKDAVW